ncbi:MAG: OB-fold putative lipoprotein [Bacteroidetes bacterium]|nr:OB-fold putative lipoprotein [Bacteroidota bacterium]
MKNWTKILIGLIILGSLGAFLGYKFIYNKPHRNFEAAKPDFVISAEDLFNEYHGDKQKAQMNYNGKVVEISGTLHKVEMADSLTIAVFVMGEGMFGDEGIRCTMLPNHAQSTITRKGQYVRIKGFVSGYNDTDIIIEKCSIVYN